MATFEPEAAAGGGLASAPLQLLFADDSLPDWNLPSKLARLYGGPLGFTEPCMYANFVASLDGVVALGPEFPSSGSVISGREPADRFVMGLLRACADAVLIGAGTLRASPKSLWTPEEVYPAAAAEFACLRQRRHRPATPELVVVTGSGELPADHPALGRAPTVATTSPVARKVEAQLPAEGTVLVVGEGRTLDLRDVLAAVHARGHRMVLTEAGPRVFGQLVGDGLLDELFVTFAPVLAGRADTPRPGLVAEVELLPTRREGAELLSVRRRGSYVFSRWRLAQTG